MIDGKKQNQSQNEDTQQEPMGQKGGQAQEPQEDIEIPSSSDMSEDEEV